MATGIVFLYILSPKSIKRAGNLRKVCIFRAWEPLNTVPEEPQRWKDFFSFIFTFFSFLLLFCVSKESFASAF
jgi:hypothetical protein